MWWVEAGWWRWFGFEDGLGRVSSVRVFKELRSRGEEKVKVKQ